MADLEELLRPGERAWLAETEAKVVDSGGGDQASAVEGAQPGATDTPPGVPDGPEASGGTSGEPSTGFGDRLAEAPFPKEDAGAGVAPEGGDEARRMVVFDVGGELHCVPADLVSEVRRPPTITPLPHVPEYVLGLANLHGAITPVVDLCRWFGRSPKLEGGGRLLLVLKGAGYPVAMLVDGVQGLVRRSRLSPQPDQPGVGRLTAECGGQVAMLDGRVVMEIGVTELLSDLSASPDRGSHA